ncbi:MAG: hypothetical protein V1494_05210 [Candidatus Diapherotrites archaeon]
MEVKVHIRKGEKNKKFLKIVQETAAALKTLPPEGRVKERLLKTLRSDRSNLGAAWQDGDDLQNILGKNSGHRFDIYNWNTKTAIEIEESEVKYIWKDFVKLVIGKRRKRLENAILICPLSYKGKSMKTPVPFFSTAINISKFMSDLLWMENLAIIGYNKYESK